MLHVAVFGNSKWSHLMKDILEKEYSELLEQNCGEKILVDALVVLGAPDVENEITISEFGKLYISGMLTAIIIPKEYFIQQNRLVLALLRMGVDTEDIYEGIRLDFQMRNRPDAVANLITPILVDPYLSYLEFHVTDHCNLNCKYCTHYSPLVTEPVFTDLEQFSTDLHQLKKYILDTGIIRILGGEPLLNPQLSSFISLTREVYPASVITVVTNGLLLDRLDESLIQSMRENMAFFHISYYPPMQNKIQSIKQYLYEQQIPYTITPLITEFNKTQTLSPQSAEDFFYSCFQSSCTCLHAGKLAPCYAPFTTKYFNTAFQKNLPVNEGIDLYDVNLTTSLLKAQLLLPLERCQYCVSGSAYPWEVLGKNSSLKDWVE